MRWHLVVSLASLVTTVMALVSRAQQAAPDVPKEIAVPAGHKLLFHVEAKGVQIYKAVKSSSGALEWVLEAPLADLVDANGAKAGLHYDGPSWEATDGSKVVRDKAEDVKSAPAPKPNEDIPWLLVKVKAQKAAKADSLRPCTSSGSRLKAASRRPNCRSEWTPKSASRTRRSTISTAKGSERAVDQPLRQVSLARTEELP
jgi:hypothetical protein